MSQPADQMPQEIASARPLSLPGKPLVSFKPMLSDYKRPDSTRETPEPISSSSSRSVTPGSAISSRTGSAPPASMTPSLSSIQRAQRDPTDLTDKEHSAFFLNSDDALNKQKDASLRDESAAPYLPHSTEYLDENADQPLIVNSVPVVFVSQVREPSPNKDAPLTDESTAPLLPRPTEPLLENENTAQPLTINSVPADYVNPENEPPAPEKSFWDKTFSEKMKYIGILALFAITAIDLRESEPLKKQPRWQYFTAMAITALIALGSGFSTAVACVGSPTWGITSLIFAVGFTGIRVNIGVYRSAIEYMLKTFFTYGILRKHVTKDENNNELPISQWTWQPMSIKESIGTLVGTTVSYLASGSLTAFLFLSTKHGLMLIAGLGMAAACPPVILVFAGIVATIAFTAIFSLMFQSIHKAISENAFESFKTFIFALVPKADATTSAKIRHYAISFCKILFIAAGITGALIATYATFGAWSNSLVTIITNIDKAWAAGAQTFSNIAVFVFTAAGRLPMVIQRAAGVFSTLGEYAGIAFCAVGEYAGHKFSQGIKKIGVLIGVLTPDPNENKQQTEQSTSLWQNIKHQCQGDTTASTIKKSLLFAGKTGLEILVFGLSCAFLAAVIVGPVILNAAGNGAVADEGAGVLTKMLGWIHINPSPSVQSGLPFFTGGFMSAVLGLYAVKENYLDKGHEMTEIKKKNDSSAQIISKTAQNIVTNRDSLPQSDDTKPKSSAESNSTSSATGVDTMKSANSSNKSFSYRDFLCCSSERNKRSPLTFTQSPSESYSAPPAQQFA